MPRQAEFDIVIHGASGFTGRLVAEYLARTAPEQGLRVAWSGRNLARLRSVRDGLPGESTPALIEADSDDPASIEAMAMRARIVIDAAGPFQFHGEPVVAACAALGTDYLNLAGEVAWMRDMIDRHEARARASGARILFSAGFDSVPFELGVLVLQHHMTERYGTCATRVLGRVLDMKGSFSGGTVASFAASRAAAGQDPRVRALLTDPFALTPGFAGPAQPGEEATPTYDDTLGEWTAPFVMAPVNTRNLHRSNLLQGHPYSPGFRYDERVSCGPGDQGRARADWIMRVTSMDDEAHQPKPGEGPSAEERQAGCYDLLFVGLAETGERLDVRVHGDRDPGYGSTSKIIAETAIHLGRRGAGLPGGITLPAAALGLPLADWLETRAGLAFTII